jgi:pyrroline-5-carboxylate reductase
MTIGLIGAGNIAHALARGWGVPLLVSDGGSGRARAVISTLAGVPFERLRGAYPDAALVRAIPNTPVAIGRGVTCVCGDEALLERAEQLFARVGRVVRVPDRLMDVATALSSLAPAYAALVVEAQVDAALRRGMPAALAGELLNGAFDGAIALLGERGGDTLAVRREVSSPGGMTARGLDALEAGGVRAAFSGAMDAALEGFPR